MTTLYSKEQQPEELRQTHKRTDGRTNKQMLPSTLSPSLPVDKNIIVLVGLLRATVSVDQKITIYMLPRRFVYI